MGASISGIIKSSSDDKPLSDANVNIIKINEFNKTAGTGLYGQYIFNNLPVGKYIVTTYKYGYLLQTDTLYITKNDEEVRFDVKLKISMTNKDDAPEIKKYHSFLNQFKPEDILEIHLDSIFVKEHKVKGGIAYEICIPTTFTNKTDSTIYVLENFLCLQQVKLLVRNSKGEMMKDYTIIPDCMEREIPDSGEFIKILPHSSIKYPQKNFRAENFLLS